MLALALAMPAGEVFAQKRKSGTGARKTTTTKTTTTRKNSGSSASAVKPLTLQDVNKQFYRGLFLMEDLAQVGKGVGFYTTLSLWPDDMTWNLLDSKFGGTFSVASNTLTVKSGGLTAKFTSPDGGKTLKGTFSNNRGQKIPMAYYKMKKGPINSEICKESFAKGTFKAMMDVVSPKDEHTAFLVDFKATPDADGTGGTYKISVDNAMGIGLIKGSYTITETGLAYTSNLEGCSTKENEYYKYYEDLWLILGKKYVDGSGYCTIHLYLFNQ